MPNVWGTVAISTERLDKLIAERDEARHDAEVSRSLLKVQGARIFDLEREAERLRDANDERAREVERVLAKLKEVASALAESHPHAYAKPGCRACQVLAMPAK